MTTPSFQPTPLPVLLIEDEPSIMALVSATLERNGYEVVCIESGAEALRMLEKGRYLGVVSDMRTPGGVPIWSTRLSLLPAITPTKKPLPPCAKSAHSIWKNPFACRI
jgi:CheY-like chemotaxis protein